MIDICDFAVGLSRQLDGRTMPSERPGHRLMETWHPLGVVGVITRVQLPGRGVVAGTPRSRSSAATRSCGSRRPRRALTALACSALLDRAAADCGAPPNLNVLVVADADAGAGDASTARTSRSSARPGRSGWARQVAPRVAARFGRALLELGGNNAAVVAPSADLELAARGIMFAAAGTAGQRCTTMRRLIVHEDVADALVERLAAIFGAADRRPVRRRDARRPAHRRPRRTRR